MVFFLSVSLKNILFFLLFPIKVSCTFWNWRSFAVLFFIVIIFQIFYWYHQYEVRIQWGAHFMSKIFQMKWNKNTHKLQLIRCVLGKANWFHFFAAETSMNTSKILNKKCDVMRGNSEWWTKKKRKKTKCAQLRKTLDACFTLR